MNVRAVEPNELEYVLRLIDEYDRPLSPKPAADADRIIHASIVQSGGCVVGAFIDDSVVGTCTVNMCPNLSWSGRPYAIIENVIVSGNFRRLGVGTGILHYAVEHAKKAGCYKVALLTGSQDPGIHKFYQAAGFSGTKQGYQLRLDA